MTIKDLFTMSKSTTPAEAGVKIVKLVCLPTDHLGVPLFRPPSIQKMVEANGIEPSTSCLQSRRSPN
jgi:hypothetical protein